MTAFDPYRKSRANLALSRKRGAQAGSYYSINDTQRNHNVPYGSPCFGNIQPQATPKEPENSSTTYGLRRG